MSVSIHTPAKGVTRRVLLIYLHFNVSIHTPAKGVTQYPEVLECQLSVSIHTPAKGVTAMVSTCTLVARFNPHTREGCDWRFSEDWLEPYVSIHTPAKGVTI